MSDEQHNLPQRLAETRTLADLSQAELAKKLGVSTSLISHWEKGTRTPSGSQLFDLSRNMGVALDYLLNSEIHPDFFKCRAKVKSEQHSDIDQTLRDASTQVHFVATAYRLAGRLLKPFALRADFGSLSFLPDMDAVAPRTFEVASVGERDHVLGRAGEFQHALADPVFEGFLLRPRALVGIGVGRQRGELLDDEEVERDAADLLPCGVVED